MLRFILIIALNIPFCIRSYFRAKKMLKRRLTVKERYQAIRKIIETICVRNRVTVISSGAENLPEKDGYAMLINHQGRFDGLAVISASERQISFLADDKRSNFPIQKNVIDALGCVRIDKSSLSHTREALAKLSDTLRGEQNVAVFPEGIYGENKNELQEFKTGAVGAIMNAECPIVPVCLYDTYKVYGINSLKKVSCQVHFLNPIYFDEYRNLSKTELCALVKSRIGDKIDELNGKIKEPQTV